MSPLFLAFTYAVTWCTTLFFVLPIGVSDPQNRKPEEYAGAPVFANLKRKFLWNTLLSAAVTAVIYAAVSYKLITVPTIKP